MLSDEQAIRDVIASWLRASTAGDLNTVLGLMADDVVFLTPGQKPFGKEAFAAASRASRGKVLVESTSDIQEIQVLGELAHCRSHLNVTVTPLHGGEPTLLSGYTLTVFRKQADGRWVLARDANMLTAEKKTRHIETAVPVLRVASVAKSIAWYRDVLEFAADPFGPPDDPVFAILQRDGVELMLMKISSGVGPPRSTTNADGSWDVYVRVPDVHGFREAVRSRVPDVAAVTIKEYGCHEFVLTDPDGHVLVVGQCRF